MPLARQKIRQETGGLCWSSVCEWKRPSFRKNGWPAKASVQEHAQCTPERNSTNVPESREAARDLYEVCVLSTSLRRVRSLQRSRQVVSPLHHHPLSHPNARLFASTTINEKTLTVKDCRFHLWVRIPHNLPTPCSATTSNHSFRGHRAPHSPSLVLLGVAARNSRLFDSYKRLGDIGSAYRTLFQFSTRST